MVAYDVRHILTTATDKSDSNWTVVDNAWTEGSLHAILTGLVNGVSYDVQVRAATASVDGAWSATTTGTPAEPGATRSAAAGIAAGLPVRGVLGSSDDVDYFRFVVSGTAIREYYAYTTGDTDTSGALYDRNGRRLKTSDDAYAVSGPRNFMLTGRFPPGTYYVKVEGAGDAQGSYTLHVGVLAETTGLADAAPIEIGDVARGVFALSGDVDYFKLVLPEATDVAVRAAGLVVNTDGAILDSNGAEIITNDDAWLQPYHYPFAMRTRLAAGTYYIRVSLADIQPYFVFGFFYTLHVDAAPEPGGTRATAARLTLGDTGGGSIDPAGDVDWFRIDLASPARVWISASSRNQAESDNVNIELQLTDQQGVALSEHIYDFTYTVGIPSFTAYYNVFHGTLAAGTYYLRVRAEVSTDTGTYLVLFHDDSTFRTLRYGCPKAPAGIDDPFLGCQWHFANDGSRGGEAGEDINLGAAWNTTMGAGINVAVVDNGLDWHHADLRQNVLSARNHSYRTGGDVSRDGDSHGTAVAGLIAARDNDIGVRGVAPRASIYAHDAAAVSLTANYADALSRGRATTSVSNNSWSRSHGPYVGRGYGLLDLAIESGLREGDGGKGVVYVTSAGNHDRRSGWASLDEMKTHHGVTVVCSVDNSGERVPGSEQGPNLWVCAPSEGSLGTPGITTTARVHQYRDDFSGTSASAPQVSGVAALVRAANRALTWRDVKLILAETARKNDSSDSGWQRAGRRRATSASNQYYEHSHQYGFGVVDAEAAVQLAATWTSLPPMRTASATSTGGAVSIPDNGTRVSQSVEVDTPIDFVEWVEVDASFQAPTFRDLEVELVSPSGAVSVLSRPASATDCPSRCALWSPFRFGSARHLGEDPSGTWILRMRDLRSGGTVSKLDSWTLTVYGHRARPGPPPLDGVAPGDGSLTVSWKAPSDPGSSAVTGYDVRHIRSDATDKSDGQWTVEADAAMVGTHSYTITGVGNGIRRDVAVRAKNLRVGEWSVTAAGTPGATNGIPFFTEGESATRTVVETDSPDVDIGSPLEVRDDGASLVYALDSTGAASFDITSTGQLQTKAALDYETRRSYSVTVSVRDSLDDGGLADNDIDDTITVTIEVTDVNEPPTVTGPTGPDHPEATIGRPVARYSAVDPEGSSVSWSLSGSDAASVWIDRPGALWFPAPPDFESPGDADGDNVYEVTVEASDGVLVGRLDVQVTVTDVNEAPVLTGPSSVDVDEGTSTSTSAAVFSAVDPESDPVSWALSGDDRDDFSVSDGVLSFRAVPDFESPADRNRDNVYRVTVRASDGSVIVFKQATVRVIDVDEDGTLTLPTTPLREGQRLRARLEEPDTGVRDRVWLWERSTDRINWTTVTGATGSSLRLTADDVGQWLRVMVTYTDTHGAGKVLDAESLNRVQARPVLPPPPPPPSPSPGPTGGGPGGGGPGGGGSGGGGSGGGGSGGGGSGGGGSGGGGSGGGGSGGGGSGGGGSGGGGSTGGGGGGLETAPPGASELFEDVPEGVWYESAVTWMILHEVTRGCAPTRFCSEQNLTRQQFVTFLWRAAGQPAGKYTGAEAFADVEEGVYSDRAIGWGVSQGITLGCTQGSFGDEDWRFCPKQQVTRGQMATLLYRHTEADYLGSPPHYTDVEPDSYYAASISWLTDFNVVPGCGPRLFCPNRAATRAEAALFINGVAIRPHIWGEGNTSFIPGPG